jgi:hypothetical protein
MSQLSFIRNLLKNTPIKKIWIKPNTPNKIPVGKKEKASIPFIKDVLENEKNLMKQWPIKGKDNDIKTK